MGTGAKRSALDLGGGLGSDGWGRIAPWRRALMADACAAQAARIAQGLQLATDPRLPSTGVPETLASGLAGVRARFGREEGVEPASR
jgi:hypothetical protein